MVHAAEQMTPVQVSVLAGTIRVKLEQREADFSLTEFLDCLEKNDALPPRMMAPLVGGQVLNFDSFDVSLELIAERLAAYQSLVR
jgi:hypothetical protein